MKQFRMNQVICSVIDWFHQENSFDLVRRVGLRSTDNELKNQSGLKESDGHHCQLYKITLNISLNSKLFPQQIFSFLHEKKESKHFQSRLLPHKLFGRLSAALILTNLPLFIVTILPLLFHPSPTSGTRSSDQYQRFMHDTRSSTE